MPIKQEYCRASCGSLVLDALAPHYSQEAFAYHHGKTAMPMGSTSVQRAFSNGEPASLLPALMPLLPNQPWFISST